MDKGFIPADQISDPCFGVITLNEKGQTYSEYMHEKNMIRGSAKLRDAVLKFLKEREK